MVNDFDPNPAVKPMKVNLLSGRIPDDSCQAIRKSPRRFAFPPWVRGEYDAGMDDKQRRSKELFWWIVIVFVMAVVAPVTWLVASILFFSRGWHH